MRPCSLSIQKVSTGDLDRGLTLALPPGTHMSHPHDVLQVNAEAMHARTFTSWRQNVLMGLHDVVKSKGGSFAHHIYNVNYNIETDLGHMEGRLAEI